MKKIFLKKSFQQNIKSILDFGHIMLHITLYTVKRTDERTTVTAKKNKKHRSRRLRPSDQLGNYPLS